MEFRRVFFFTTQEKFDRLRPFFGSAIDEILNGLIDEWLEKQDKVKEQGLKGVRKK